MKKILLFAALLVSAMSWAAVSITVTPNVIDFGTIELNDEGEAEANTTATLTWSGVADYCSVFVDTIGAPAAGADYEFWATKSDGTDFWYCATGAWAGEPDDPTVYVGVYAIAPGEYSIKYNFYSYATEDDWYAETNKAGNAELIVKAKVVAKGATDVENVQATEKARKVVRNGQVYILRNGELYNAIGAKVE